MTAKNYKASKRGEEERGKGVLLSAWQPPKLQMPREEAGVPRKPHGIRGLVTPHGPPVTERSRLQASVPKRQPEAKLENKPRLCCAHPALCSQVDSGVCQEAALSSC